MHCSKFNEYISSNNITDIKKFKCGNVETVFIFFFECVLQHSSLESILLDTALNYQQKAVDSVILRENVAFVSYAMKI